MARTVSKVWLAIVFLAVCGLAAAQEPPAASPAKNNPYLGDR